MRFSLMLLCLLLGFSGAAQAKRVALVIGNDDYETVAKLQKAVNDSKAVADTLNDIGFEVMHLENLKNRAMNRAIFLDFISKIQKDDEALFYYAGHGIEVRGRNYLLATDIPKVKPGNEHFITTEAFAVDEIMTAIEERGSRVSIMILDACRDNPFPREGTRSLGATRGLGRTEPPKGSFVMYSAGSRQAALDRLGENDPHPNSVYTRKLLPLLKVPGLPITKMAKLLRGEVDELASSVNHNQYPAYYDQLKGEFFFVTGDPKSSVDPVVNGGQDVELWKRIETSRKISDFEFYLAEHPKGRYASVAKLKLKQLKEIKVAVVTIPKKLVVTRTLKTGEKFKDCAACPSMIVVPAGSFIMGAPRREKLSEKWESPQHKVVIAKPFAVGQFEITRKQYDIFINDSGYQIEYRCKVLAKNQLSYKKNFYYNNAGFDQGPDHPAVCVSWHDAKAYVKWLNSKVDGVPYRLLSEAEWEYTARAGTKGPFWWGKSITTKKANFFGKYRYNGPRGKSRNKTVPVNSFAANRFGLYNVHGNATEWIEDCWHFTYNGAPNDGSSWTKGACKKRMVRGGSWLAHPEHVRSAFRSRLSPDERSQLIGFRVAKTIFP